MVDALRIRRGERHLCAVDETMRGVVAALGPCSLAARSRTPPLAALVDAMISQQISIHAAAAIRRRVVELFGGRMPSARRLLQVTDEELRAAGLSAAKVRYLRDLATHVAARRLRLSSLQRASDEDVVARLTAVKGIGKWTAEVFLIFHLGRLDVLPADDLGLLEGARLLYGLPQRPAPADLIDLAEPWRPYRSIGSWYLWRERRRQMAEARR